MKVLVNCYACSPYRGSEPGMGWKFVLGLSKEHELHVLVESRFEDDIKTYKNEYPGEIERIHFYFIKKERHKLLRKIWPPSYYWFYKAWQKKAYLLATELDKNIDFDIVHQLNMVGYREPGFLWKIDKPFVWGPIGGMENVPWTLLTSMGTYGCIYYACYNIINTWQTYTSCRVRLAMRKASGLISATSQVRRRIQEVFKRDSVVVPEVGQEQVSIVSINERSLSEPVRLCWCGQHTDGKSLNLLIEALATLVDVNYELHVIGEGAKTGQWKELSRKLRVDSIIWHGWVDRKAALSCMSASHLLCITSLKDLTSTVLLEALSCGLPVIALNHCGFQNVIHDGCGRKIDIRSKKQVVTDFAAAIKELAEDESLRQKLAQGALKRAQEYNWNDKIKKICEIYESV